MTPNLRYQKRRNNPGMRRLCFAGTPIGAQGFASARRYYRPFPVPAGIQPGSRHNYYQVLALSFLARLSWPPCRLLAAVIFHGSFRIRGYSPSCTPGLLHCAATLPGFSPLPRPWRLWWTTVIQFRPRRTYRIPVGSHHIQLPSCSRGPGWLPVSSAPLAGRW